MKRVVVAMSGGVDSSVSAFLLKREGYEVIGVTMCFGIEDSLRKKPICCGEKAIEDARRVADKLGIKHYVLNMGKELKEYVINDFCSEYLMGRTPNPCIRCNQYIKFGILLEKAREMDAQYLATGHYARIEFDEKKRKFILKKGIDIEKDQSYFLYILNQEKLNFILMPLGNFTKKKVREIARENNLPVAEKPGSQEICFIPDKNYGEFLKRYIKEIKPGPIKNLEGKVISEHKGIIFYTIGQRERIGIVSKEPLYIVRIDQENNTLFVGRREDLFGKDLIADNLNLIDGEELKKPIKVEAKIRYQNLPSPATIIPLGGNRVRVKFDFPQWAVTPGQAVVFYDKDILLGGARIIQNGKFLN